MDSHIRGGGLIRRAADRIGKFKGRDFLLWNLASALNPTWPTAFSYTDSRGLRFRLDLNDPAYRALYLFGQYERDLLWALDHLLEAGDVFVEAGTSIGLYTTIAASKVGPDGHIFGFEPLDSARESATWHAEANGFNNVTLSAEAIGAEAGTARIFSFSGLPTGHASLANLAPPSIAQACQVTTLDAFLEARQWPRVRLIKLDVEGSEFPALQGAHRTIERSHPRILVEANPETAAAFGWQFLDLEAWLVERDYKGYLWSKGRWSPLPRLGAGRESRNVLFLWSRDDQARALMRMPNT
jgi:FkbM family methyltransferase